MKKILLTLTLLLFTGGCIKTLATTNSIAEKTSRTYREVGIVKNDLELQNKIEDTLKEDLKLFIKVNNFRKIGSYYITAMEGRILVTGVVANNQIKNFIYNRIWENKDVEEVINELDVSLNGRERRFKDFLTKEAVRNRLRFSKNIKSVNYEISVIDGQAFIIGIAEDEMEIKKVGYIVGTTKGVNKAVIHVIRHDDVRRNK